LFLAAKIKVQLVETKTENYNKLTTALNTFLELKDTTGTLECYRFLMMQHLDVYENILVENKIAKDYFDKIENLNRVTTNAVNKMQYYIATSYFYMSSDEYYDILKFYDNIKKGLELVTNNPSIFYIKTYFLSMLAIYYQDTKQFEKSIAIYKQGLTEPMAKNAINMSIFYQNIGIQFENLKNYDSAIFYLNKAKKDLQNNQFNVGRKLKYVFQRLYPIYYKIGNFEKAWETRNLYDSLENKLLKEDKNQEFLNLQTKY
jgi:tetratricopeptide (TPR) repeat protein